MATSSITKNFVISGKEQVEMFINAIEESAKIVLCVLQWRRGKLKEKN